MSSMTRVILEVPTIGSIIHDCITSFYFVLYSSRKASKERFVVFIFLNFSLFWHRTECFDLFSTQKFLAKRVVARHKGQLVTILRQKLAPNIVQIQFSIFIVTGTKQIATRKRQQVKLTTEKQARAFEICKEMLKLFQLQGRCGAKTRQTFVLINLFLASRIEIIALIVT